MVGACTGWRGGEVNQQKAEAIRAAAEAMKQWKTRVYIRHKGVWLYPDEWHALYRLLDPDTVLELLPPPPPPE